MTRPRKNPGASGIRTRDLPLSRQTPYPQGQRGGITSRVTVLLFWSLIKAAIKFVVSEPSHRWSYRRRSPRVGEARDSRPGWVLRWLKFFFFLKRSRGTHKTLGAGIMEADDRQVTTVFTVQPSVHHRHSTNPVSWSVTIVSERRDEVWLHVRRRW